MGHVSFFPEGEYRITSTLELDGGAVRLSGSVGPDPEGSTNPGARIVGNISGSLIHRQDLSNTQTIVIEDLGFQNGHASGTCVSLNNAESPSGVYRCFFDGYKGLQPGAPDGLQTHSFSIIENRFRGAGGAGSVGLDTTNHHHAYNNDVTGYEKGILVQGVGCSVIGGRIEVCTQGVFWGLAGTIAAA